MTTVDTMRILVVEDHPVARKGIVYLIDQEPDLSVCAESASIAAAVVAVHRTRPDVAVVDIGLSDGSGIDLIRTLKADHPELPTVVLSMHSEVFYAERALRAGARGYVTKAEDCESIIHAIRDVVAGRVFVSPELANQMLSGMVAGSSRTPTFSIDRLTDREFEVFEHIGQGQQTQEIARMLHISVGTVDAHREHIKKKLNVGSAGKLMVRAIRWAESGGRR